MRHAAINTTRRNPEKAPHHCEGAGRLRADHPVSAKSVEFASRFELLQLRKRMMRVYYGGQRPLAMTVR